MAAPILQDVRLKVSMLFRTAWLTTAAAQRCAYSRKQLDILPQGVVWGAARSIKVSCTDIRQASSALDQDLDLDLDIDLVVNHPDVGDRPNSITDSGGTMQSEVGLRLKGFSSFVNISSFCHRGHGRLCRGVGLLGYSATAMSCCIVPARHYGRKMRLKPPKSTHFEYSGDLRGLPQLDKSSILYTYRGMEDQLEGNEMLKRLSSVEFSSSQEFAYHRQELIRDRIMELFSLDSELEQRIALLTLEIRQMIPYCIQHRTDKLNKIWLLKRIFRRRRLLTKLRETDHERFEWLLRELKIRYVIPKDHEENKGWRQNLKITTQTEAVTKQRKRLEELKEKFEKEKQTFHKHQAQVLANIEKDLQRFGLNRSFLK